MSTVTKTERNRKPVLGERAGRVIFDVLRGSDKPLATKEIAQVSRDRIPGCKAGPYVNEGLHWLRSQGIDLEKQGRAYRLKDRRQRLKKADRSMLDRATKVS